MQLLVMVVLVVAVEPIPHQRVMEELVFQVKAIMGELRLLQTQ
jgi:hypothetical protein